ncbi:DUF3846 domain-containing protein [Phenylobacterium sp.]|mgnify:CR=1 FL=1|uniref:DUF3846 domain-containing protein n=1 Tax=Phenylobacterium sp. TaxID=1871053 RepID=UPI000C96324B|nr:DUF3846 domain-containing protein [Phenylobacterium sp.]MAK80367.1 hypothetical protein [Phenylobacterium sp.]|tara:strand:+ start:25 stop:351 length:327 start_codon:yes stop_codon:yes gene_type:complete
MSDVWAEVRVNDNCMWRLKGKTWNEEPSLEEIQKSVGGYYEMMPQSYLMDDIGAMYVNDKGMLHGLDINQLATQQTTMLAPAVVGNTIIRVDEKILTKKYWLAGDESE